MVAKLAHNHNTAQNTTHNNQQNEPPPYPQRLCPLSPWVGQRRPQILAPRLPMGPLQAPGAGFAHATAGSLAWMNFEATSKNREIGGASALGGRRSINTYHNRMQVGFRGGGYIAEEARPGRNVWGGRGPVVFAVKRSVENREK
jgi:hypothetical protein